MFILNFHHVEPEPLQNISRKKWTIQPTGLRRIIKLLRFLGVEIISLRDFIDNPTVYLGCGQSQKAILTFDDGYENFYHYAYPIILDEQCPVTLFILAGKLAGTNTWDQASLPISDRDSLLSEEQLHIMSKSPLITYGSHGLNHLDFGSLNDSQLQNEIHSSFEILEELFGTNFIPALAYPWGRFSPKVLEVMERSPYRFGLGVRKQRCLKDTSFYDIPRCDVYFRDGNIGWFILKMLYYRLLG